MTTSIPLHMLKKWDLLHTSGGTPFCNARKLLYQITLPASTAPATIFRPRQPSFPSVPFRRPPLPCAIPLAAASLPAQALRNIQARAHLPLAFLKVSSTQAFPPSRPIAAKTEKRRPGRRRLAPSPRLGFPRRTAVPTALSFELSVFYSLNVMPFSMLSTMHRL